MTNQHPEQAQPGTEFPSYFDPDREAKAQAREEAEAIARGEDPRRDGQIEVDEWGNPVDPTDPDLIDAYRAAGLSDAEAAAEAQAAASAQRDAGVRMTGFPFPGLGGTTRGGTRWQVSGCCLPIPLLVATVGMALVRATRR